MLTTITVEDVEHFRARDPRSVILARYHQVARDAEATTLKGEVVYTVAGQRVILRQVPGGYTADHDCADCVADRPCWRALAAVDAEGTERFITQCDLASRAAKLEMAR